MKENLLQNILRRLHALESPVILHAELDRYPGNELASLRDRGILGPPRKADRVPRPKRFGPGPAVDVHEGLDGLIGTADEPDFHYEPIHLNDEDTWYYPICLPQLVDAIRSDNSMSQTGYRNVGGLIYVGQRRFGHLGLVDVYLSLPNSNGDAVLARCRRLDGAAGDRWTALLTPDVVDFAIEDRRILASSRIIPISLTTAAAVGHLRVGWDEELAHLTAGPAVVTSSELDLERLIRGKVYVGIVNAAKFLELSQEHVERLVRQKKLCRMGKGRPTKISVASLREYKGTPKQESPT